MKQQILEMEDYAIEKNVPIIEKKSIAFIMKYIKDHNVKNILEIGAAIGYSAILMASSTEDAMVTTIERDEERYMEALKNIKALELEDRITPIFKDALDVKLKEKFDLIFLDGAKGQNIKFFEKYEKDIRKVVSEHLTPHDMPDMENWAVEGKETKQWMAKSAYEITVAMFDSSREWNKHLLREIELYEEKPKDRKEVKNIIVEQGQGNNLKR